MSPFFLLLESLSVKVLFAMVSYSDYFLCLFACQRVSFTVKSCLLSSTSSYWHSTEFSKGYIRILIAHKARIDTIRIRIRIALQYHATLNLTIIYKAVNHVTFFPDINFHRDVNKFYSAKSLATRIK